MLDVTTFEFVGRDLHRPECVLVGKDGALHVADSRGGVTVIAPDGGQSTILAKGAFKPKPNGICILADGSWLLTHLGDQDGGVYRLASDGTLTPFLLEVDGAPLPPTNYVHVDGTGRTWVTVSTIVRPRILDCKPDCAKGFIVLVDEAGARVVADGIGFSNECVVHPESGKLYINETFARRLSRFDVAADGGLSNKTTVAAFGDGDFPDGLTFDADGGVWITSVVSNRLIRVDRDGGQERLCEDCDRGRLAEVEAAFQAGALAREHLDNPTGRVLKNISSLAFGGMDMKTVYMGCLQGDALVRFRTDQAGLPPAHWMAPMPTAL